MRLVVFGPGHPFRGGIAVTTTAAVQALRDRGHEAAFLTPRRQYPSWLYPGADDRDPEACPILTGTLPLLDPLSPASWPELLRAARAARADAWVFPYWTWVWAPLWRVLLRSGDRPPTITVVHNPADHDAGVLRRRAAVTVLRRADGLFTHGRRLASDLENLFPSIPVGHHLLPATTRQELPASSEARDRLGLPADAQVGLVLGLIRRYKGVDVLLDAVARLPKDGNWHFVVAGEAWDGLDRELPVKARQLGIEDRVHFHFGWLPEAEVPAFLAAADLMVLPYRSGSQSAVAPIALAHGLPVLVTAVGGLPELVGDEEMIIPPGDPGALATALASLDPGRLQLLSETVQTSARPTWEGYAAALEKLLDRVCGCQG